MKNIDKIQKMSVKDLADLLSNSLCRGCIAKELCNQYMITGKGGKTCKEVFIEWLEQEHIEPKPMPEIKIGDVIFCNVGDSKEKFIVMSDILANNLCGATVHWRELKDIWQIKRINDKKEILEVIWRDDNE